MHLSEALNLSADMYVYAIYFLSNDDIFICWIHHGKHWRWFDFGNNLAWIELDWDQQGCRCFVCCLNPCRMKNIGTHLSLRKIFIIFLQMFPEIRFLSRLSSYHRVKSQATFSDVRFLCIACQIHGQWKLPTRRMHQTLQLFWKSWSSIYNKVCRNTKIHYLWGNDRHSSEVKHSFFEGLI